MTFSHVRGRRPLSTLWLLLGLYSKPQWLKKTCHIFQIAFRLDFDSFGLFFLFFLLLFLVLAPNRQS